MPVIDVAKLFNKNRKNPIHLSPDQIIYFGIEETEFYISKYHADFEKYLNSIRVQNEPMHIKKNLDDSTITKTIFDGFDPESRSRIAVALLPVIEQEKKYVQKPVVNKDKISNLQLKVLIIGNTGVGKSSLLLRFSENVFNILPTTTIGIDFKMRIIEVDGRRVKLQIWDTAGQERFKTITQSYYKGAHAIIVVYDITDRESFQTLDGWFEQLKQHARENVVYILVGNKADLQGRQITYEEGEAYAEELGILFFETSAKTDVGVTDVFYTLARQKVKTTEKKEDLGEVQRIEEGILKLSVQKSQNSGCC